ncbi:MAG: Na/Pi cotransporter family protein [Reichenbachiella sp.]
MNKTKHSPYQILSFVAAITVALLIFLWSLDLMTTTFQEIGNETVLKVLQITSNPFISLFIGLFITAVIQSSSTSTSLIVAIVASGSLSLENAIPMIMGANIGTTLTSTVISLSYITNNREFKDALTCGVMHDFFNIMTVIILFPLEYYYNMLSKLASSLASIIGPPLGENSINSEVTFELFHGINTYLINIVEFKIFLILLSAICLFISIKVLSKIISKRLIGNHNERFQDVFFRSPINSFGFGTLLTSGIQSSSISTTIIVPIGATGKIPVEKIFPYIVGANIGTTLTALIAAFNKSEAAQSIALAHFLFNAIGTIIFLLVPYIKDLPSTYAKKFAEMTVQFKVIGFVYILVIFFILPLALIFINNLLSR